MDIHIIDDHTIKQIPAVGVFKVNKEIALGYSVVRVKIPPGEYPVYEYFENGILSENFVVSNPVDMVITDLHPSFKGDGYRRPSVGPQEGEIVSHSIMVSKRNIQYL